MGAPMNKKKTFQQLLAENCTDIAKRVSDDMLPNLFLVGGAKKIPVPHDEAILYRWWFPKDSDVMAALRKQSREHPELELAALLDEVETRAIGGKWYYALYFGKSNNGRHRYRQHTEGNVHISTLRRTIYGLCIGDTYDETKEPKITNILSQCYFEWISFGKEGKEGNEGKLVECIEGICIALGKYPLNVEGNPAISDKWCKELMDKRKLR